MVVVFNAANEKKFISHIKLMGAWSYLSERIEGSDKREAKTGSYRIANDVEKPLRTVQSLITLFQIDLCLTPIISPMDKQ